jgi:hypothetical protein
MLVSIKGAFMWVRIQALNTKIKPKLSGIQIRTFVTVFSTDKLFQVLYT